MTKTQKIVTVLGVVLFLGLIAEGYARKNLGLGDPPLYQTDENAGYLLKPDQDVQRFGRRITSNEFSMRSDAFDLTKADDELRIMAYGNAILFGGSLTDQDELATTLLQNRLRAESRVATVGNISAPNWGPENWLGYARNYGYFDADALFIVVTPNQVNPGESIGYLDRAIHPQKRPFLALWEGFTRYFIREHAPWLAKRPCKERKVPEEFYELIDVPSPLESITEFITDARMNRVQTIVLLMWPFGIEEQEKYGDGAWKPFFTLCEETQVQCVDLGPLIEQRLTAIGSIYRADGISPDQEGHRIIAEAMYESVRADMGLRTK